MAAATVRFAQLPGDHKMMTTPKVGTEFLASSHFSIAQDNSVTEDSLRSVFKKDYPPWLVSSRPPAAEPPLPAHVLHRDDRFFNEKRSETNTAYDYRGIPKPLMKDAHAKLSATNFKMDKDLSKFDSFHTTHKDHYTPKDLSGQSQASQSLMVSCIPQGDPEKAPKPLSDYRDRYRGHDALSTRPVKAGSAHQGGPPTITGDGRLHHFFTTHNDQFQGVQFPKVNAFPAPVGSNIPQGDKEKEATLQTTKQASFPSHNLGDVNQYDKNAVMGKLQKTNFVQDDGHKTWDTYASTFSDSYKPKVGQISRSAPTRHRNHSDFPSGDDDPYRLADRANMTTNRFYLGEVDTPAARIVSGANLRTKSNVWFGEPRLGDQFYETTVDTVFQPKQLPGGPKERPDFNTRSCVPVDYYPNEKHLSTTYSDFQNPKTGKMIPNARAVENLKQSHIRAPLGGERQFTTEHLDQYTSKYAGRVQIDPGRLQRSSVPLGTLIKK